MLKKCNNNDKEQILNYIGNEHYKCLYLYLDLIQYGCENKNVSVWIQTENKNITSVILKYYTGMHIFSKQKDYEINEIIELIDNETPAMICGEKFNIEKIYNVIKSKNYEIETGWVRGLKTADLKQYENVEKAVKEDFKDIATLIYQDEDLGSAYKLDELTKQMYERNREKFTRNFVIHKGGKVIAHASTGAENDKVATMSYVITAKEHRGQGLAYQVCSNLCKELLEEGKEIYLINYSKESTRLYDKLGFKISCEWGKLYLNLKKEGMIKND